MTDQEIKQYFDYHNKNIKLLKIGFETIRDQIKELYKSKNGLEEYIYSFNQLNPEKLRIQKTEKALSRILSGIQVSWAEESLKRLLYESSLFNETQRNFILNKPADQKWLESLKIIFCIAYDLVPIGNDVCENVNIKRERRNLGTELVNQYLELKKIITQHLMPNFQLRNKIQHGEWEYAFTSPISKEFSQDLTNRVNQENLIVITSRFVLVNSFYNLIVDLGRFKSDSFAIDSITTPFEYFYKDYLKKIKFEVTKINNSDIEKFILEIIEKEKRGLIYRQRNNN